MLLMQHILPFLSSLSTFTHIPSTCTMCNSCSEETKHAWVSDFSELVFEENIEEVGEMEVHPIDFLGVALFSPCISRVCIIM